MGKKYIIGLILLSMAIFFLLNFFNFDAIFFENVKKYQNNLHNFVQDYYFQSVFIYLWLYIIIALLPVPGDFAMALLGGFLFGVFLGVIYAIISVTLAGIIAFLFFRYLFNYHEKSRLKIQFEEEFKLYGPYFLLSLRIVPLFPVFMINMFAAYTAVSVITFAWTTALGMLPHIIIYVVTGRQINAISSLRHILSFPIVIFFFALAMLILYPVVVKYMRRWFAHR